ncbi:hypothetical protein, unlikely [Trypanosoma brucei gambiense DAL972]|uniref:Uncharacterized protein n=1 Tax=Trypanosoma brucei gambiense (strain MHOM/CI/86/DAL972) TaxID=679716 RepID=C9ZU58_TRYB9|nr:hypothetical protein, unlikely [Trypanosoma brucei gambiense DAL972]CBH12944.1 hypothetical protein, unlikely [Trypanosoma brucei gambiense DAL972]|eukprot:XP_011775223.1 hypothetical protein, unlikely [Trypanosoma brucei gambiense DAL972]
MLNHFPRISQKKKKPDHHHSLSLTALQTLIHRACSCTRRCYTYSSATPKESYNSIGGGVSIVVLGHLPVVVAVSKAFGHEFVHATVHFTQSLQYTHTDFPIFSTRKEGSRHRKAGRSPSCRSAYSWYVF